MPGSVEEQKAWLFRVLGIAAGDASAPPKQTLKGRLTAAIREVQVLKAANDPRLAGLLAMLNEANGKMKLGDPDADRLATELELQLGIQTASSGTPPPPSKPAPAYGALAQRWQSAQDSGAQALKAVADGIVVLEEVRNDPRFPHVKKAVRALPDLWPASASSVTARLTAGGAANPQAALEALAIFGRDLEATTELKRIEDLAARHLRAIPVLAPVLAALDEIQASLAPLV